MDEMENGRPPIERPWIALDTTYDVEAWIDAYNRELQRFTENRNVSGYGICFVLGEGGELYLHTTPEGEIVLDMAPDAEWVAPLITAATGSPQPVSRLWPLPATALTQLILGLSPLVAATRTVVGHDFGRAKYR